MNFEEGMKTVAYYWKEKEDIDSWCEFEEFKQQMENKCPEILSLWKNYKDTKKLLSIVLAEYKY